MENTNENKDKEIMQEEPKDQSLENETQQDLQEPSETPEKEPAKKEMTEEEKLKEEKNKAFEWVQLYAAFILFFNICLVVGLAFTFSYTQKKINTLSDKNKELQKTIGPLQDFYNQKEKLIRKELYEKQQAQIVALQKEKVSLLKSVKDNKQIILSLSRSLQEMERINKELEDEKSVKVQENKNLSRNLKYEKMKADMAKQSENTEETQ